MIYFSGSILDYCAVWCFSLLPYMGCIHISIYIYIYKIDMVSSQIGNVFCCQVHGSLSGTEERCCGQILPRAPFPRTVALCAGRMPRLALIGSITYICIVYTYIYNIYIYIHRRYTYTFLPSLRFLYGNHPSWEQPVNNRTTPHVRCWIWTSQRPQSKPRLKGDHTSVFRYPRWGAWWLLPPQDPNIEIIPKSHKYLFLGLPTWMVLISISSWSNCLMARLVQGVHPTYVCWFMNPSINK